MTDTMVKTTIFCSTCDTPVISTYGDLDYIDPEGVIAAYCAAHA